MKHLIVLTAVVAMSTAGAVGQVFSLDDNPTAPLTSAPGAIPGLGAEDPYGLGLPGGGLAPSPTLAATMPFPVTDGDLLMPGAPVPFVHSFGPNGTYVNALSADAPWAPWSIALAFSVDRVAMGMAGSAVSAEAAAFQQPGDIYASTATFTDPAAFAGGIPPGPPILLPTAGAGGSNALKVDESLLGLTVVGAPGVGTPAGTPVAPPAPGTHDNVDAFEWDLLDTTDDFINDKWMYFSVNPDEALLAGALAADIYDVMPGSGGTSPVPYATAASMGLDLLGGPNSDDIDALVVWDNNVNGGPMWGGPGAEPGIDYALFSLSPGSVSLAAYGLSPADILFTDFSGAFAVYALSTDIGLLPEDNVDALVPEPATMSLLVLGGLALLQRRRA